MKIEPFGVEQWMNEFETKCEWNIAETCVESLTLGELLDMAGQRETIMNELLPLKLTYGAIEGSDRLRNNIAGLYEAKTKDNVVVTHGGIGANHLVLLTLIEPGDKVIAILPNYQQHKSIPESIGADVKVLRLREEQDFLPDLEELKKLVGKDCKLITMSNPNNPTGALMDRVYLEKIVEIAQSCGAYILSDEVYRSVEQSSGITITPSVADLYDKGISTGSMSKAFSLAGLRLGWICGPTDLIHAVSIHRDYSTISVGMIDDLLASIALEQKDKIRARNLSIVRENLAVLDAWVAQEPLISYVKPRGGTTVLLKYALDVPSRDFCVELLKETGVMLTPGSVMEMEGYLRIGYANNVEVLKNGLRRMSGFLERAKAKWRGPGGPN